MKIPEKQRARRPDRSKDLLVEQELHQEFDVESLLNEEDWKRIWNFIPSTVDFTVTPFEQKYEASSYFCALFPERCTGISIADKEKKVRAELTKRKKEGREGWWLQVLLLARSLFPDKKGTFSLEKLWPELQGKEVEWYTKKEMLMCYPSQKDALVDEKWKTKERNFLSDPDLNTWDSKLVLMLFDPEFRASLPKDKDFWKKRIKELAQKSKENRDYLRILMRELVHAKILFADEIQFQGDAIIIQKNRRADKRLTPLPARPELS